MASVFRSLARHWLLGTLCVFSIIFGYANSPLYGADATPTPNVSTVPKPSLFFTPTPTVTPVILIVTRAPATLVSAAPEQANEANAPATPAAPVVTQLPPAGQPPATAAVTSSPRVTAPAGVASVAGGWTTISTAALPLYQMPNPTAPLLDTLPAQLTVTLLGRNAAGDWVAICCGRQQQAGWVLANGLQVALSGTQTIADLPVLAPNALVDRAATPTITATTTLTIQVPVTTTLVWPGAVRQLPITLTNQSGRDLTQLQLRYQVPAALTLVNAALDQPGATVINSPTAQGVLLAIRWPQLPAGSSVVALLTLQVGRDVPDGTLVDNQIDIKSSDGATARATFTLVMPPADLPHFPAPSWRK